MSDGLLVLTPLRIEQWAVGRGVPARRTGMGPRCRAGTISTPVVVAGLCGALDPRLRPGDVVVADEVRDAAGTVTTTTGADWLATAVGGVLGPVLTVPRVVRGAERVALGAGGALAVDMESAYLLGEVTTPRAVVRVVVDTPDFPLLHPHTVPGGIAALRRLHRLVPELRRWAHRVHSPTREMEV